MPVITFDPSTGKVSGEPVAMAEFVDVLARQERRAEYDAWCAVNRVDLVPDPRD